MVSGKFELWSEDHYNPKGMSIMTTMMFVVGEMAGAGILSMPGAMRNSMWYGVILLAYGAIASGYTGCQLGWSWTILQELWPKYTERVRKPYASIGERAIGTGFKNLVSGCLTVGVWATATLYIILAADQTITILKHFDASFDYCHLVLIFAVCLWPVTMLGTPTNFWLISFLATISSSVAVALIIAGALLDRKTPPFDLVYTTTATPNTTAMVSTTTPEALHVHYPEPTFLQFCRAYSSITFAYGGHFAFPTMQHDMKRPADFWKSVVYGYVIISLLYFPVSIIGYFCYGDLLSFDYAGNVTGLIEEGWIRVAISLLTGAHVCFAFFITINPVNQEIEQLLEVPHRFGWERVLVRSATLWLSVFVAESLPQFGNLLSLIGATTITSLTYILPPLFYLALKRKRHLHYTRKYEAHMSQVRSVSGLGEGVQLANNIPPNVTVPEYALNAVIVILGLLAGVSGTYSSLKELINTVKFKPPCYIKL